MAVKRVKKPKASSAATLVNEKRSYCKYPDGYCDYPCEFCIAAEKRLIAEAAKLNKELKK